MGAPDWLPWTIPLSLHDAVPTARTTYSPVVSYGPGCCKLRLGAVVQCDAVNGNVTHDTWRLRCSFPVYLIAMSATAGALGSAVQSSQNTLLEL